MGIVVAIVVIIAILIMVGKSLPEQKSCSDCKHWGGPSQQGEMQSHRRSLYEKWV